MHYPYIRLFTVAKQCSHSVQLMLNVWSNISILMQLVQSEFRILNVNLNGNFADSLFILIVHINRLSSSMLFQPCILFLIGC